ncbi:MAG: hypothetical protein MI923_19260 [Phycisphaerales bacterium]|nr:hypothetical protein [Phycisphaerales bacterium]
MPKQSARTTRVPAPRWIRLIMILASLLLLPSAETTLKAQFRGNSDGTTSRPATMNDDPRVRAWWQVMGWGLLLIVIAITCSAAIIIFSRRFKKYLTGGASTPTPSDDVWAMHRLPEERDDEPDTREDS